MIHADLDRIRAVFPDLVIRSTREVDEGLVNRILIVNETRVFRFPRNDRAQERTPKWITSSCAPMLRPSIRF